MDWARDLPFPLINNEQMEDIWSNTLKKKTVQAENTLICNTAIQEWNPQIGQLHKYYESDSGRPICGHEFFIFYTFRFPRAFSMSTKPIQIWNKAWHSSEVIDA